MSAIITPTQGDLTKCTAEAIVNTVNCVGIMGRGLALDFKKAFPENFAFYEEACHRGELRPGGVLLFDRDHLAQPSLFGRPDPSPRYILNVATKQHWRFHSRPSDVVKGARNLAEICRNRGIKTIAVPPMGCGLGGLDWKVMRPLVIQELSSVPGLEVLLYDPPGFQLDAEPPKTGNPAATRRDASPAPF